MPYGTMSICDPSSDRFEDEAVPPGRPSVHILCLCYEARQFYGSKYPNKENSLVTSISYYKYFAEGLIVETFRPPTRISAWFEIRFPFQLLLLLSCPTGSGGAALNFTLLGHFRAQTFISGFFLSQWQVSRVLVGKHFIFRS